MSQEQIQELKAEFKKVIACGWECNAGSRDSYYRFSFRVCPKSMAHWRELTK